ncbi:hypothetical protein CU103_12235 [Phyllobacterium sophorae]|uniref:Uncharacterized protein n=1 Tax=Phyllobacterium sophorae TaxID=1520277 RepID=A0A2P7BDU2_9HYPH|nr:hypothetical protein CU103_12235 [Phyllobacterium sophorae]
MPGDDNKQDEIIEVKIPRKDYETLRDMIEREQSYTYITAYLKSFWLWAVIGGILTVWSFWDKLAGLIK